LRVGVPDRRRAVDVINRRRDEENFLRHETLI
jgi:hypothetical protein